MYKAKGQVNKIYLCCIFLLIGCSSHQIDRDKEESVVAYVDNNEDDYALVLHILCILANKQITAYTSCSVGCGIIVKKVDESTAEFLLRSDAKKYKYRAMIGKDNNYLYFDPASNWNPENDSPCLKDYFSKKLGNANRR